MRFRRLWSILSRQIVKLHRTPMVGFALQMIKVGSFSKLFLFPEYRFYQHSLNAKKKNNS